MLRTLAALALVASCSAFAPGSAPLSRVSTRGKYPLPSFSAVACIQAGYFPDEIIAGLLEIAGVGENVLEWGDITVRTPRLYHWRIRRLLDLKAYGEYCNMW